MTELNPQQQECLDCYFNEQGKNPYCKRYQDLRRIDIVKAGEPCRWYNVILHDIEKRKQGNPELTFPNIVDKILEAENETKDSI